jgi:hypothetical protein
VLHEDGRAAAFFTACEESSTAKLTRLLTEGSIFDAAQWAEKMQAVRSVP